MHEERRTNLAGNATSSETNRDARAQGRRSTARWGARALLAGLLVLLAGAQTAQAIVLVSNMGQAGAGTVNFSSVEAAQRITTGSNPVGYILESIDLRLSVPSGTAFPTVTLRSGSARGHVVRTAVAPTTGSSGFGNYTYTLQPPVHLPRSRDYWIEVSGPSGTQWTRTAVLTENDTSRKGWIIGDKRQTRAKGSSTPFSNASADESMLLGINGYVYNPGGTPPSCLPEEPDQVWCADITAQASGSSVLGWREGIYGSILGDTTFEHEGETWEVHVLEIVGGDLYFGLGNLDGGTQGLQNSPSFKLKVGNTETAFTDGEGDYSSDSHSHFWEFGNHSVTLTDKETYTVRLLRSNNEPPQISTVTRANPRDLPWFDTEHTDADTLSWEVRFTERLRRDSLDAGDFRIVGSTATVTSVTLDRDGTLARVTAGGGDLADYNGTVTLELASGQNIMDLAGTALTDTSIRHAPRENSYEVQNYAPASNYLVSNTSRHSHLAAGGLSDFDHAQGFRTGGHADGYTLSSVAIKMNTYTANKYSERTTAPTVQVVKGSPGATTGRITLTAPTLKKDRRRYLVEYTAPANTTLERNTNYFVVIRGGVAGNLGYPELEIIDSGGMTARPGWSLQQSYQDRQLRDGYTGESRAPSWVSRGGTWALQIEVRGEAASQAQAADPPAVQGTPVLSGAGDDGTWSEGETVRVDLTFSESVDVDTSAGTPSLGIELGTVGTARRGADYENGSGTTTLTFAYTLVAGDGSHTSMAVTPDSLALGGGTIRSSESGLDALLGHVGAAAMGSNARSTGPQANFHNVPENHDGETPFTLTVAFGGAPDGLSPKRDAGSTFELEGGAITKSRQAPGQSSGTWELTVTPAGTGGVTVRVPTRRCSEAHAVCIGGRVLSEAAEVTIAGTQGTDNAITARVTAASASHDGSASFEIDFEFSHAPRSLSYRTVRDDLFDVTGGRIANASRLTRGESLGWRLTVQPDGDGAVTVSARATSDCEAAYAVCDAEGRMFDGGLAHTVPGPASESEPEPEPESGTLPVVSIAAGETPVNEGTDLSFTLSRTGSTDDALTVSVSVSETGDVLAGAPPTSVTFAAGAATATLSVATVDDETVEVASTVRVTLSATSSYRVDANAGRAEGVVESEDVEPMTARFTKVVDEHGGSGTFVLRFAFSHEPAGYSYKTVHNHLFDVTGGTIEKARRLAPPSNVGWELRVAPDGFGEVALSARATTDCSADYAACDAAGRMFDGDLSTTIAGPPTLSVADATVEEAEGAVLDFAVTLSRAVAETVTVDYATSNGSAAAGSDYTGTSGTLIFAANETSKTVPVPVLDDAHDEGSETMGFTLSNPSPERVKLADASAQGRITNVGGMPQAWTARFGRTVAEQAMDAVQGRFTAPRAPGRSGRIAGLDLGGLTGGADAEEAREADVEGGGVGTLTGWLSGDESREPEARTLTGRDLVTGSSFAMTEGGAQGGFASYWGRGAVTRFDGREGEMTLDGEVTSALLGADFSREAFIAGVMLSHARGAGGYRSPAGDGEVESTLTALFPYGRIERSERVSLWGMAGYGEGTLTLAPDGAAPLRPDLSFRMGAVGARGVLAGKDGASVLALKSDALAVLTSTGAVSDPEGGNLAAAEGQATRLRLALEGALPVRLGESAVLIPSLELGVRHDGGDAETGFGADIGAGIALSDPARGLTADIRARGLLTHEAGGLGERGLSGTLSFDPAPGTERGFTLNLTQSVGGASWGGADALLGRTTLAGLGAQDGGGLDARRLDARIGYGFGVFEDRYTAIPELGLGLTNAGRELRFGWRLAGWVSGGLAFEFGAEGTRREQTGAMRAEHGLTVGAGWRLAGSGAGSFEVRVEAARHDAANDDGRPEHTIGARLSVRW
ncbi:MAG: hypothetical protein OXC01_01880 [Immundisolibacterales bacterium]|nr:hypothetical protein [Immundisolibacterales bacterium]